MSPHELDRAIQASFDGSLSPDECLKLRAILKADPAARALYYQYADLHQSLVFRISRFTTFDSARSLADMRLHLQSRRSARMALAAAAAALIMIGVLLRFILIPEPPLATYRQAPGTLFSLENSNGGDSASGKLKEGSSIHLRQGTFEFTLLNGTRGLVLAPARFELRSEGEMRLNEGTAWFEVPPQGTGFQVVTPQLTATDLGTEFGILATPHANHEVHVFAGKVLVRSPRGNPHTLTTGQARRRTPNGQLEKIPVEAGHFLTSLPQTAPSNLLFNGDFEAGMAPPKENFGTTANAALLPGWCFGRDVSVALHSLNGNPGFGSGWSNLVSPTKDVQVSFNNARPPYEVGTLDDSIWQTFATVPGQEYEVLFSMGGYFANAAQGDVQVTARIHDGAANSGKPLAELSDRRIGKNKRDTGYNRRARFTFTAISDMATLVLTETSLDSDHCAPAIDNVVVRPLAPPPADTPQARK